MDDSCYEYHLKESPLLNHLQTLRLNNEHTDVVLKVGNNGFPAHRIVLISLPFFKQLFSISGVQNEQNTHVYELDKKVVNYTIVEDLLTYLYTSKVRFTVENVDSICIAAQYLGIESLSKFCEQFLVESFRREPRNVCLQFLFSVDYRLEIYKKCLFDYIFENFAIAIRHNIEFVSLTAEVLKKVLIELNTLLESKESRESVTEVSVQLFKSVIDWTGSEEYKHQERSSSLSKLLRCLSLHNLLQNSLNFFNYFITQPIIPKSHSCSEFLIRVMTSKPPHKASLVQKNNKKTVVKKEVPRQSSCGETMLKKEVPLKAQTSLGEIPLSNVVKKTTPSTVIEKKLEIAQQPNSIVKKTIQMKTAVQRPESPKLPAKVIVQKPAKNATFIQKNISKFHSQKPKNTSRFYSFGGDMDAWPTVSMMDCETGSWMNVARMTGNKRLFSGAVTGSRIFIVGGREFGEALDQVEAFDPETQKWESLPVMPQSRWGCAAAALGEFIYVTGGNEKVGDDNILKSVIRFDVRANRWSSIEDMNEARYAHQLVPLNGRLYAIGGYGTKSVEEYNPSTRKWRILASTEGQQCWSGAVAHDGKIYVHRNYGFEVYSPESNAWQKLLSTPEVQIVGGSLLSNDDRLLLVGASTREGYGSSAVFSYKPEVGEWKRLSDMDVAKKEHCSFVFG